MAAWPEHVREILAGDVCVALGYRTPAAGVVLTPVTTIGMFDEVAGTVTTTSSFGNWKKLARIDADDRVALVFHAREHGTATSEHLVVVQGHASFPDRADGAWFTPDVLERLERYMPAPREGRFWDWVGREYLELRVPVTVSVHRMIVLPTPTAEEPEVVLGEPLPAPAPPQSPPRKGTGPRVTARRYARRLGRARHTLVGYTDAEGFPMAKTASLRNEGDLLVVDAAGLPTGGRRAGVLAHWFDPQLVGQGSLVLTGWLEVDDAGARYAPHTTAGYEIPASTLMFSLGGGLAAKLGYRQAVKDGYVRDETWQRAPS